MGGEIEIIRVDLVMIGFEVTMHCQSDHALPTHGLNGVVLGGEMGSVVVLGGVMENIVVT